LGLDMARRITGRIGKRKINVSRCKHGWNNVRSGCNCFRDYNDLHYYDITEAQEQTEKKALI
jgi:formate dehydrogenase maturation protein FdhE